MDIKSANPTPSKLGIPVKKDNTVKPTKEPTINISPCAKFNSLMTPNTIV